MIDLAVDVAAWWLAGFEPFVLGYFLVLNSLYLVLVVVAAGDFFKYLRRAPFAGHDDVFANPLTPGVSIIVPAYNEQAGIVQSVRSMLSLRYPLFEVVVVDDGSTDATFDVLNEAFDLVEAPFDATATIPLRGGITGVHVARRGDPLTVVRKHNGGSSGDATNAGLHVARHPLVCMIDADSLLDPTSLLRVVKPFVDDPEHVVATGGVVRPANGLEVSHGEVVKVGMPKRWLGRIQVIEYLRSFLLGRSGWSALDALLVISGAFGMFRRDLVVEVGGMDASTMGQDAELVARLHRHLREQGRRDYRMVFVSEPVCWTEVPETLAVLRRQRRRWSRGLAEMLWKHKRMLFNPRYGRMGLVVLPYFLVFELLGPLVEVLGFAIVGGLGAVTLAGGVAGVDVSLIDWDFAVLFLLVAMGYGFVLSVAALAVEEMSFHRLRSWRDLALALAASLLENVWYRPLHSLWRLEGLWWWLRRGASAWGHMPRAGFGPAPGGRGR